MEKGMTELHLDHLEIAARTWGVNKAREVAGTVVDSVLTRTRVAGDVSDPELIRDAEAFIERFLAACLKNCIVEFSRSYDAAMTERVLQLEKLLTDALDTRFTPPFIQKLP